MVAVLRLPVVQVLRMSVLVLAPATAQMLLGPRSTARQGMLQLGKQPVRQQGMGGCEWLQLLLQVQLLMLMLSRSTSTRLWC